jgi:serine/threonine protein kinase
MVDREGRAKLAGFGLAREAGAGRLLATVCGSVAYCAPEVVRGEPHVWSLGVLLYAMCSGRLPWTSRNAFEASAHIASAQFAVPMLASDGAKRLILRTLALDPAERPTAAELLAEPRVARPAKSRALLESQSAGVFNVRRAKPPLQPPQPCAPGRARVIVRPQFEKSRQALVAGRADLQTPEMPGTLVA